MILGISGSHRHGNTEDLVKRALAVCAGDGLETEFVSLADTRVEYCTDCGACRSRYFCVLKDDVMGVLDMMKRADAIIVGSPVYFGGVSGKLRALFDRTLPLRRNGMMLSGKVGGAIAVGGSRNGGQELAAQQIHAWMLIHEMTVVGDRETAHFGGIAWGRNPGDALKDEIGVATVENLARRIVECVR